MKKVKTLIAVFICMFATTLFAACTSKTTVSVESIAISDMSDNLVYDEGVDKYLIRQGETFTITYELLPEDASDKTVYVNMTPANKISCETPIINTNDNVNEVMFEASTTNSGDTLIEFETKDGGEKVSIKVEVVGNLTPLARPTNIEYDEATSSLIWDEVSATTASGLINAKEYQVLVNDSETYTTDTNSLKFNLDSGVDYYVRVKAIGTLEDRTGDSDYSTDVRFYVAKTPLSFAATDGVLTWNYFDSDNITGFKLDYGTRSLTLPADARTFDFATFVYDEGYTEITYPITITAVNKNYVDGAPDPETGITTHILNSRSNPQINLTKLASPKNVRIQTMKETGSIFNESILSWEAVKNASYYSIKIFENGSITPVSQDDMKVGTDINLSQLLESPGDYTVEIVAKGDSSYTFSKEEYTKTTLDFAVLPLLSGAINFTQDILTLNTTGLIDLLDISAGEIGQIDYEVFYSTTDDGNYENVVVMNAAQEFNLSSIMHTVGSDFYMLIRPLPTARYTTKNIVVPHVESVAENKTISSKISQLKTVEVKKVDKNGVLTAVDINQASKVDQYKFILYDGSEFTEQTIYRSSVVFDAEDNTKFTISVVELFNIVNAQDYTIKVVPLSSSVLDANERVTMAMTFTQLGSIEASSIVINDNEITWDNINKVHSYLVSINGNEAEFVNTNSFYIEDMSILNDNNTITIQAIGDDERIVNGKEVVVSKGRAAEVSNIRIVDGVLTWDDNVANSTYHVIISYELGNTTKVECSGNTFEGLDKIAESATVSVVRSIPTAFNSAASDSYIIERLATPSADLTIVNNSYTATFGVNNNSNAYKIRIFRGTTLVEEENIYLTGDGANASVVDNKVNFTLPTLSAGHYLAYIQSLPSNQASTDYDANGKYYLISEYSQSSEILVYPQVEIEGKTGTLSWSLATNEGVKDYVISFVDDIDDIVTTSTSYDFAELASGTYEISISATSTNTNVIYAQPTTTTIVKVATPTLSYSDNKIVFTNVENSSGYRVYNHNDELLTNNTDYSLEIDGTQIAIVPKNLNENEVYGMYVVPVGSTDVIDGDSSNKVEYKIIGSTANMVFSTSGEAKQFVWNAVENNKGYRITIKDVSGTQIVQEVSNTNSYTIPAKYLTGDSIFEAGTYTFEVVVLGNKEGNINLIDSQPTTITFVKLDTISNMSFGNDVISWTYAGEGQPDRYYLSILTMNPDYSWTEVKNYTVSHVEDSVVTFDLSQINDVDNFKIMVTTIGTDATSTIDSESELFVYTYGGDSESELFTKLAAPTVAYANGVLTLNEVSGAERYEVYSYDGAYTLLADEYTLNGDTLAIDLRDVNTLYSIVVKAIASSESGKLNSVYSSVIKVNKLSSINDLEIDSTGTLRWTKVDNANGYIIYNLSTGSATTLAGGDTNHIGYESLYADQELGLGDSCEFVVQAIGTLDATNSINYLNGGFSNAVNVSAVDNINAESLVINNGLISWADVSGVTTYIVELYNKLGIGSYNFLKSFVVNANNIDITNVEQIVVGNEVVARVTPFSTSSNNFVILQDSLESVEIEFYRYNTIKDISIENGLIKFTIDLSAVSVSDIATILGASNYEDLPNDIAQKYYGYYNFKIDVKGYTTLHVTLNDMRIVADLPNSLLYATYELDYQVQSTRQLELAITSMGNSGDTTTDYNAIGSTANTTNHTSLVVYKYSAPKPTASDNLVSENGKISFRKIHTADGTFTDKYILNAHSGAQKLFYIITIPSGDEANETYTIDDVNSLTFSYYDASGAIATTNLDHNREYIFSLTTLGTESGNTGTLYLRSNAYASLALTFLYDESGLQYRYTSGDANGGYLSWIKNDKCLSYTLYLINSDTANDLYAEDATNVKANSSWVDGSGVIKFELSTDSTEFMFYDISESLLPSGSYWVAIRPNGNGTNFITAPNASQTVEIYKLNSVVNSKLENGTFVWETKTSDNEFITGYKIIIQVYVNGESTPSKIIERGELITTNSYTLEESVVDIHGDTYTLNGFDGGGSRETYGVVIIAVGGASNGRQCVCSTRTDINNSNNGYARLDKVAVTINSAQRQIVWTTEQSANISEYKVYNNDTLMSGDKITQRYLSFDRLTTAGDFPIEIVAIANGSEYLNSLRSDIMTIIKYYPPELAVEDGLLVWDSSQNGITLKPYGSTVYVYKGGELVRSEVITDFSYVLDSSFASGEYTIKVKFNDNQTEDTYSIGSEVKEINVFKLANPTIESVSNFSEEKECEEFDSAIKWKFVTGKDGEKVTRYTVKFSIFDGEKYVIDESLTQQYYDANYSTSVFLPKGDYLYMNISNLGNVVTSEVAIIVTAMGNSLTNAELVNAIENSIEYDALLDSTESSMIIDYSIGKPNNAGSDTINGIIRWSGSDNDVLITLIYDNDGSLVNEKVHITKDYMDTYGKVYYLPYMTSYQSVQLQFIIGGTHTSNTLELSVSNQTLFSSGTGTEADPYIIENAAHFANIKHRPLSYLKVADGVMEINLTNSWDMIETFGGHLIGYKNGDGETTQINGVSSANGGINGITINAVQKDSTIYAGLFKTMTSDSAIKNITFNIGSNINASNGGPYSYNIYMAGVAIDNRGIIENVTVKGAMVGYTRYAIYFGGVVVNNYGIISGAKTTGFEAKLKSEPASGSSDYQNTISYMYAGGISYANYNIIEGVTSNMTLSLGENQAAKNRKAGGIVYVNRGLILNSDFTGLITSWDMAGIALENIYTEETIKFARTYKVDGHNVLTEVNYSGGSIIGCSSTGILKLYTTAKTSNNMHIGGIVGINYGGKIGRSYSIITSASNMDMTGFYTGGTNMPYVGGIVAFNSISTTANVVYPVIENSYAIVEATFTESSSRLRVGSAVGSYSSSAGSNIDYSAVNYGLNNVVVYSAAFGPIYGVSITDSNVVETLSTASQITQQANNDYKYAVKLNTVETGDTTYEHAREFAVENGKLILTLNKIITN